MRKKRLKIIWLLMLIGSIIPFGLFLFLSGGIMSHIYNNKLKSKLVKDNYTYAIRTFWFVILMVFLGLLLDIGLFIILDPVIFVDIEENIGVFIFLFTGLCFLYRVIRGWRFILSEETIYDQEKR